MKLMKRITLISAFVALSGGVQAEWLEIYKFEDGMRVFVDRTTVSRSAGIAEVLIRKNRQGKTGTGACPDRKSHTYRTE